MNTGQSNNAPKVGNINFRLIIQTLILQGKFNNENTEVKIY